MERRLAAVLNADVVGYSRLMSADEPGTLKLLKAFETGVSDAEVLFSFAVGCGFGGGT